MKKLLLIIFLFTTINTFAQVKVGTDGNIIPTGIYPAVKSNDLKGTVHIFKTIVQRNALPANYRDTGMIAYVTDSLKYYYLYNGITNADWQDLLSLGLSSIYKQGDSVFFVKGNQIYFAFKDSSLAPTAITTNRPHPVQSIADMLAIPDAVVGDIAIVADSSKSYVLQAQPTNDINNWLELLNPVLANTDYLPEGTINLYSTTTRIRNAINGGVGIDYNKATGVITNLSPDTAFIRSLISDSIKSNKPVSNGLISTGPITLVDSTLTIQDTVKWAINGIDYQKVTASVFTINSADSGYYRKDLIYADTTGQLYKLVGVQDTAIGVAPKTPDNTVIVTTVDVYGGQVVKPTPQIIQETPDLQMVTNQGYETSNPIFTYTNATQTPFRFTQNVNHSAYLYGKNMSSGNWANTGFLFKNDVPDNPADEHTGHFVQLYMGSTTSAFSPDGGLLRVKGSGGLRIAIDSGRITFNSGSPSYGSELGTHPFVEMGAFETDGSFRINKYKNNVALDSVLSTDPTGKVILKKVAVGDIDVLQAPDSSYADIKKLDGTHKYVVIEADGLVNNSVQSVQGGTGIIVNNTDPLNPIISTTSGGNTYTASNGLTKNINDIQLGGSLTANTTINIDNGYLLFHGSSQDIAVNASSAALYVSRSGGTSVIAEGGLVGVHSTGSTVGLEAASANIYDSTSKGATIGNISYDTTGNLLTSTDFYRQRGFGDGKTHPVLANYGLINLYSLSVNRSSGNFNEMDTAATNIVRWTNPYDSVKTASYTIQTANNGSLSDKLTISGSGATKLNKYGSGLFTGTATHNLAVDASGNIIEVPINASGTYTPTFTNTTNLTTSAFKHAYYTKIGNIVHVSVTGTLKATATGQAVLTVTLPVSGNATAVGERIGQCTIDENGGTTITPASVRSASSTTITIVFNATIANVTDDFNAQFDYTL